MSEITAAPDALAGDPPAPVRHLRGNLGVAAIERSVRRLGLRADDHALVTAHLGNGCSCAAVRDGRSLDTTMGLTPLDGLVT